MEIIQRPRVVRRRKAHTLGIRVVTPFRGMLRVQDDLMKELFGWLRRRDVAGVGRFFMRLHVVDMKGPMDIEVGVTTAGPVPGDARVRAGILPEGRYATLRYRGAGTGANRALIEWARARGVELDHREVPDGDRFACRYESYATDPRTEPRKKSRIVELSFLTRAKASSARRPPAAQAGRRSPRRKQQREGSD
jgi:effector-binding domain-containing protein